MEDIQSRLMAVPDKKPRVMLDMVDCPELFDNLNKYKRSMGWTWKRLFLLGVADAIIKRGDNPDIVMQIADYLEGRR